MGKIYAGGTEIKNIYAGGATIKCVYSCSALIWGGIPKYYETITPLAKARSYLAGSSNRNYALFGGGEASSGYYNGVDAYNSSLVRSAAPEFFNANGYLASAKVNDIAVFSGGNTNYGFNSQVYFYDSTLTRNVTTLQQERFYHAGASLPSYAVFAGGAKGGAANDMLNSVEVFNSSMVRTVISSYSGIKRRQLAGTSVGNYVLFAGGQSYDSINSSYKQENTINYLNNNLVSGTLQLSYEAEDLAGAFTNDYAIFAGGFTNTLGARNNVDSFNASLVRTSTTVLTAARCSLTSTTLRNHAIFSGGVGSKTVDMYDNNLLKTNLTDLSVQRHALAGASIDKYALFAGGLSSSTSSVVDVYLCD